MARVSMCDSCLAFSKQEALSSSSTSKLCRNADLVRMNADERRSDLRHPRLSALREAVRDNIVRRVFLENRLAVGFEPGVTVDFAAAFIPHAEDDPCRRSIA